MVVFFIRCLGISWWNLINNWSDSKYFSIGFNFILETSHNLLIWPIHKMYTGFKVNTSINKSNVSGLNESQL